MTEALLVKTPGGLIPQDDDSREALSAIGLGKVIRVKFTQPRNLKFHRKFFALVNFAYEHWEPGTLEVPRWKDVVPEKNKDQFRKDLVIMAGYYNSAYRIDGSFRVDAKSISFGSMSQEEFDKLYSAVINVVLKKILTNYTREDLDNVVDQLIMGFG